MGGSPLYSPEDKIVQLNNTNFQANICGSQTAWMVEFYSSWCGHCIHFAPTFKELAADVYGWRSVISVGSIDCAMEENMPTCREYEVMGYPSIKFFSPATPAGDMGEERQSRDKTIPAIKRDMVVYLWDLLAGRKGRVGWQGVGQHWPQLLPAKPSGKSVPGLWEGGAVLAVIIVEEVNSTLGSEVMLDIWPTVTKLKVPLALRRIEFGKETEQFLTSFQLPQSQGLLALSKDGALVDSFPSLKATREDWYAAIKDFIWRKSSELSLSSQKLLGLSGESGAGGEKEQKEEKKVGKVAATRKELINRRYKVFTSDLEKAVLYSISHEVAQHSSIAGQSLMALQDYVTVLEKYFPARMEMSLFLGQLKQWVNKHQDTIRGEDLSKWIQSFTKLHGLKTDKDWIGCKGSKPQYGGYPCGLWSVWHALTVRGASLKSGHPSEVLKAMQKYIQEFFGCRECARHFQQALQDGEAIKEEVKTHKDAVLFLWKVHNKANQRLQGDISEDPVFPKVVFPPQEFCKDCYNSQTGTNLWDEFNRNKVFDFLTNLYSLEKLNSQGLTGDVTGERHALVPLPQVQHDPQQERLDTTNFRKEQNSVSFVFFNGADISICFMLWAASAILLIGIYLKFVSGKRFCHSSFLFGRILSRRNSPLLPK